MRPILRNFPSISIGPPRPYPLKLVCQAPDTPDLVTGVSGDWFGPFLERNQEEPWKLAKREDRKRKQYPNQTTDPGSLRNATRKPALLQEEARRVRNMKNGRPTGFITNRPPREPDLCRFTPNLAAKPASHPPSPFGIPVILTGSESFHECHRTSASIWTLHTGIDDRSPLLQC